MAKKVYNQNVFLCHNYEFKLRNLVTFKRWNRVKDEKFKYYRG